MNTMRRFAIALLALFLSGCGILDWFDSDDAHKPTPLADISSKVTVTPVWNAHIGEAGKYFFSPAQVGEDVVVADTDGDLVRLNSVTGAQVWKVNIDDKLAAGVGADAGTIAVVTVKGDLVVFDVDGKQRWRGAAGGEVLSAPGVGDGVVVIRTTDGRFLAFDSGTGSKRWNYSRQNQPLVLRTAPGMVISAGMLYSGVPGGRLIAITDINGGLRWDAPVTIPKGTTELERVADVMGKPVLANREICVASFQGRAGCFDINTGGPIWTREISTTTGIGVDGRGAYVSDESSVVQAFARSGGGSLWKADKLQYRKLTAPLAYNGSAVVGDLQGYLHWLSEDDGSIVGRTATDGSPLRVSPVLVTAQGTQRLIAQTAKGGIYAFTAQ
jgi:outer membrane protein assembly factor BamB